MCVCVCHCRSKRVRERVHTYRRKLKCMQKLLRSTSVKAHPLTFRLGQSFVGVEIERRVFGGMTSSVSARRRTTVPPTDFCACARLYYIYTFDAMHSPSNNFVHRKAALRHRGTVRYEHRTCDFGVTLVAFELIFCPPINAWWIFITTKATPRYKCQV